MPIWAYFYCCVFLLSCAFGLFDKNRLRRSYQPAGEILYCLCGVLIFLIGFSVVQFEFSTTLSTLCFVYTFTWSYHAHRHYLNYENFKSDIHKSAIAEHEKLLRKISEINEKAIEEGVDPSDLENIDQTYDFDQTEKEAKYFYIGTIVVITLILIPYLYVYLRAIGLIGS
ncbi:hypothetical protein ISG33_13655 [Glaciecola sp. MH2013]|uniref:hypothetical protein n=1 Tax=Glaciecola sp. MH2013 TaxID=2785524 RepID=UPI00189F4971|nr:hypothetical protein [Glaciecola sp. MH2013]MBF7074447.1 hypothetical protein [Glaciecola sp. MH2013]